MLYELEQIMCSLKTLKMIAQTPEGCIEGRDNFTYIKSMFFVHNQRTYFDTEDARLDAVHYTRHS